jgi:dihydroneopterin aldolase
MINQDIIFIKKLKIETYLGIYDWEQTKKQSIMLDIKIGIDNKAAKTNNLNDTINYQSVYNKLVEFITSGKFQLIETLAEQVAYLLFENFPTNYVKIKITKPFALKNALVGITLKRTRY